MAVDEPLPDRCAVDASALLRLYCALKVRFIPVSTPVHISFFQFFLPGHCWNETVRWGRCSPFAANYLSPTSDSSWVTFCCSGVMYADCLPDIDRYSWAGTTRTSMGKSVRQIKTTEFNYSFIRRLNGWSEKKLTLKNPTVTERASKKREAVLESYFYWWPSTFTVDS